MVFVKYAHDPPTIGFEEYFSKSVFPMRGAFVVRAVRFAHLVPFARVRPFASAAAYFESFV